MHFCIGFPSNHRKALQGQFEWSTENRHLTVKSRTKQTDAPSKSLHWNRSSPYHPTVHCSRSAESPAGQESDPWDPPRWSQNDYVSSAESSPTVGSSGQVEAQCWKRLVFLLLTLTWIRPWLMSGGERSERSNAPDCTTTLVPDLLRPRNCVRACE